MGVSLINRSFIESNERRKKGRIEIEDESLVLLIVNRVRIDGVNATDILVTASHYGSNLNLNSNLITYPC